MSEAFVADEEGVVFDADVDGREVDGLQWEINVFDRDNFQKVRVVLVIVCLVRLYLNIDICSFFSAHLVPRDADIDA